ncbi:MAG: hypothetical protein PHR73_05475 [Candidatus Omnitrophica bacterium]|nr:hypothetical protein [Candidatus Omnitrophota bacterium]
MSKVDLFFEQHEKKFYVALAVIMAAVFSIWYACNFRLQNLSSAYVSLEEGNYGKAIGLIEKPEIFQEYLFVSYAYLKMAYLKDAAGRDQLTDILLGDDSLRDTGKFAAISAKEGYEAASRAAYKAQSLQPEDPDIYILMAFIAAANKDFNMAQVYAGEALQYARDDTKKSQSYLCMAFVFGRKAIKLADPLDAEASYNQAVMYCRKTLYFDPKNDLSYQVMGVLMMLKKRWPEASSYFKEAQNAYYLNIKNAGFPLVFATNKRAPLVLFNHISVGKNNELIDYAERQSTYESSQGVIPKE